ncbi:LysR family transcriptional regulator [Paracoccus caeni]|uniref:LysR family transcriptional regulator n=1 Tax=Paracoccus caeni TaxID=657651 RepID=A0A934SFC7_9RHOB|nr:LysR family transcriptional regulator [Paracoccus caeni]MBK4216369.1 LysR family transcriptional regulator [Paracoccus caeni]
MDRFRQMQIFVQVVESGNLSRAAEALRLPRSTVSTELQALEDRLQCQLLHRTTRQMVPTRDGIEFLPVAREIIEAVLSAESMFLQPEDGIVGRLRIDMPSRIARKIVVPALPGFLAAHPGLSVELSAHDRFTDLVANAVDCALRVGSLDDSGLIGRKLGDLPFATCASPDYLARFGTPKVPDDLAGHRLVSYAPRFPATSSDLTFLVRENLSEVTLPSSIMVDNAEAYIAAAVAGLGIVQLPAYDVQDLIAAGLLVALLPEHAPPPEPLTFLFVQRRNLPRGVRLFQEWLVERLVEAQVIADPA